MLFVPGPDDTGRDGGAEEEPVQSDLRHTLFSFPGDLLQSVDNSVQMFVSYRWPVLGGLMKAAAGGQRLGAPNLSRQTAPPQRTPDQGANSLVKSERHEFPFVLS